MATWSQCRFRNVFAAGGGGIRDGFVCILAGGCRTAGQGMNVFSGLVWFWEKFCLK